MATTWWNLFFPEKTRKTEEKLRKTEENWAKTGKKLGKNWEKTWKNLEHPWEHLEKHWEDLGKAYFWLRKMQDSCVIFEVFLRFPRKKRSIGRTVAPFVWFPYGITRHISRAQHLLNFTQPFLSGNFTYGSHGPLSSMIYQT